jgi:hypothetical protein
MPSIDPVMHLAEGTVRSTATAGNDILLKDIDSTEVDSLDLQVVLFCIIERC